MKTCFAIIVLMSVSPLLAQQSGCDANYQIVGEQAAQSVSSNPAISDIVVARTYGLGCLTTEPAQAQNGIQASKGPTYSGGTALIVGRGQSYAAPSEGTIDCGPAFSTTSTNDAVVGVTYYNVVQDRTASAQGCENAAYRQDFQTFSVPLPSPALSENGFASPSVAAIARGNVGTSCSSNDCTQCKQTYRTVCDTTYQDCRNTAHVLYTAAIIACGLTIEAPPAYFICAGAAYLVYQQALRSCSTAHDNCILLIDQNCYSQCHP